MTEPSESPEASECFELLPAPEPAENSRRFLDAVKKREICAIVAMGCSRIIAARYVGCHPDTIRRTAKIDEQFAEALEQAESQHEVLQLSHINKAAKDGRYWRAAAWTLERKYPSRYGNNPPHLFTIEQVSHVLQQFSEMILEEISDSEQQNRILTRVVDLITGFEASKVTEAPS